MTADMTLKLRRSLLEHEAYRKFPYLDTEGKITIGIGYNLTDRGIDDEWINRQYLMDITYFNSQLSNFPWFKDLNADRQIILVDMAFMGWKKFLEFESMFNALSIHDYQKASDEMLNSEWAKQVKNRSVTLAQGMLTGVYNV